MRSWWRLPLAAMPRAGLSDFIEYDRTATDVYGTAAQATRADLVRLGAVQLAHPRTQAIADQDRYYRVRVRRTVNGQEPRTVKVRDVLPGDQELATTVPAVIWLGDAVADYQ